VLLILLLRACISCFKLYFMSYGLLLMRFGRGLVESLGHHLGTRHVREFVPDFLPEVGRRLFC
jgi:hypothetical protein